MLESIGMDQRQILKMLFFENIYLAVPNMVITLTAGGLAGYGTVWGLRKFAGAAYMHFQFPAAEYGIYALCMLLIPHADHICLPENAEQGFSCTENQLHRMT